MNLKKEYQEPSIIVVLLQNQKNYLLLGSPNTGVEDYIPQPGREW